MSRSEDVLLIVKHVKYKKVDGSFYVMSARIGWMNQSAETFRISASYEDTRVQRISPDNKEKVQLQLLMNDGTSYTFQFANPVSRDKQLEDRDAVKELLQQLLPKFKNKAHSELEEKRRVLLDRPELMALYKELVVSGIMSVEEFWSQDTIQASLDSRDQPVGVPSHLLSDIKPQTDGANGTKYNLTGETIEAIFRTYPAVRKRHLELVPHRVSEHEFWIKFFQSHYFHRDRLHISRDDLFADCASQDEREMTVEAGRVGEAGRSMALRADEGFVGGETGEGEEVGAAGGQAQANHQLVRRFNHHSLMVLKSLDGGSSVDATANSQPPQSSSNGAHPDPKRLKLSRQTLLPELAPAPEPQHISLRVDRMDMYLSGPTPHHPSTSTSTGGPLNRTEDVLHGLEHAQDSVAGWGQVSMRDAITSYSALRALSQISGGQLSSAHPVAIGHAGSSPQALLPPDMAREVTRLYQSLGELLRHLWLCFPVTSPQLADKLERTQESLLRFRGSKLDPFKASTTVRQDLAVTQHLDDLIDTALAKYDNWKSRLKR